MDKQKVAGELVRMAKELVAKEYDESRSDVKALVKKVLRGVNVPRDIKVTVDVSKGGGSGVVTAEIYLNSPDGSKEVVIYDGLNSGFAAKPWRVWGYSAKARRYKTGVNAIGQALAAIEARASRMANELKADGDRESFKEARQVELKWLAVQKKVREVGTDIETLTDMLYRGAYEEAEEFTLAFHKVGLTKLGEHIEALKNQVWEVNRTAYRKVRGR